MVLCVVFLILFVLLVQIWNMPILHASELLIWNQGSWEVRDKKISILVAAITCWTELTITVASFIGASTTAMVTAAVRSFILMAFTRAWISFTRSWSSRIIWPSSMSYHVFVSIYCWFLDPLFSLGTAAWLALHVARPSTFTLTAP